MDTNTGTSATSPWKTFAKAIPALNPGDTLILRDGTYTYANNGQFQANCAIGGNAKNGSVASPITIRAENERKAFIQGTGAIGPSGTASPFRISDCSSWVIEGLRIENQDNSAYTSSGANIVWFSASSNIIFRKNLLRNPNRYGNNDAIEFTRSSNNILVEDNELYYFHRNGIGSSCDTCNHITVRRNYVNSLGAKTSTVFLGPNDGIITYWGDDYIFENNIVEGGELCISINGLRDKSYGNICMNSIGLYVSHGSSEGTLAAIDSVIKDHVSVNASGVVLRTAQNAIIEGLSAIGTSNGFAADNPSDARRVPNDNCVYGGRRGADAACIHNHTPGFILRNALSVMTTPTTKTSFIVTNADEFSQRTIEYSHGWRTDGGTVWGSGTELRTNSPPTPPGNVDPQLGSCRVFIPDSSPMKRAGKNGADIGANVLYAYENGVLTTKKLWNPTTGEWAFKGAIVPGINDVPGQSLFDVHQRLNVNANGCNLPASYTGSDTIAPSIPTGLTATVVSSSQINLSWTASTDNVGVTGYKVFRNGTQIATVTTTSYSDTGLTPSTTYSYTVSAYDAVPNNSTQSASVSATTQSIPTPDFPVLLLGTTLPEEKTAMVSVTKPANASEANITMVAYDPDFPDEGELYINGNGPIRLFGSFGVSSNNAITKTLAFTMPAPWWNNGSNALRFVHLNTTGYRIESASVSFISVQPVSTCSQQDGFICPPNQYCPGSNLTASDTAECCSAPCRAPAFALCSECGAGLFNLCDKTECYNITEKCYFVNGLLINSCTKCASANCRSYTDQASCQEDNCEFNNCAWLSSQCRAVMQGDINGDSKVDMLDVLMIARDFGKTSGFDPKVDLNNDGAIDLFDIMIVVRNWG